MTERPMVPESQLLDRLVAFRRAVRIRLVLYGFCAVVSGGIFALLTAVSLDWLLGMPPVPRLLTGLVFLGGGIAAVMHWVFAPLLRSMSLVQVAGRLEQYRWSVGHPRTGLLEDRLTSTVDFLLGNQDGSEEMRRQVIDNTDRLVGQIRFDDALSARPLLFRGLGLALAVAVVLGVHLQAPGYAAIGWQRYAAPFSGVRWPRNVEIVPLSKNKQVALGESAELRMRVVRGLTPTLRGLVHIRTADGDTSRLAMRREAGNEFVCTIVDIRQDMDCWFEAGDDDTRETALHITVAARPAVTEALATLHPPDYAADAQSVVVDLNTTDLSAVRGSTISISVHSSKPVASNSAGLPVAWLDFGDGSSRAMRWPAKDDPLALAGRFELLDDAEFRIRLTDTDGFESPADQVYRIIARPDEAPAVVFQEPQAVTEITPRGSVALFVRAEDDFGITAMRISGKRLDDDAPLELSLTSVMKIVPAGERILGLAQYNWNLTPLDLKPGTAVLFHAEAQDNYAYQGAKPHVGRSSSMRIKIISQAQFESRLRDQLTLLQNRLRQSMLDQQTLQDETETLNQGMAGEASPSAGQLETATGLGARQARLAKRLNGLARRFASLRRRMELNGIDNSSMVQQVAGLARKLRETATGPATSASRQLGQAGTPGATDQNDLLTRAGGDQQRIIEALSEMIRSMNQWGQFQEAVAKARDLLDRQQALRAQTADLGRRTVGQRADALSEKDQAKLRQAQRKQQQLAKETAAMLERFEKLGDQLTRKDPAGAAALEEALRAAVAADVERRMQDAEQAMAQNRLAAATMDQRAAESGLADVLRGLSERRRRELAELTKKMEQAQQAVARLLEQQTELLAANIEARQVEAGSEVFTQQASRQKILQGNTLRVADDLEATQQATGPVRKVHVTAGMMEKARAALEQSQSPTAEVQQRQAVDQLTDALAELERLAEKVRDEAYKRSLAALRDQLQQVRDRQEDINQRTADLTETVARLDRATRREYRKMARLAQAQQSVRPEVETVREQMGDAAVYRWVIDRVLELVSQSRQSLEERRLDEALASAQKEIVDELGVLIVALAEAVQLPPPDEYAEGGGGQGGGAQEGDRSPIPGVAELLVLKSMQLELNTKTARQAKGYDPANA
ncbi:MAG: DUF4175 family protein, partial [Phycisphaerae bacterium]